MICPKCSAPIVAAGRYCGACGHDLGEEMSSRLTFYFGLRDDVDRMGKMHNAMTAEFAKVWRRLQEYEVVLRGDLAGAAAASTRPATEPPPSARPVHAAAPAAAAQPVPGIVKEQKKPSAGGSDLEIRMGQKWLLIIGILAMVFGVGYFLKYSFEQGWVGPAGRVAMAYLWGVVFLIAGDRFRKKELKNFGLSLSGGGIAVLYFATFAGFQLYDLIPQATAFGVMVLITALACLLAVLYDAKWLAVLGMAGGFLTPVLLSTGRDNQIVLMTYMTILNLGLLAIAFRKKWDLLTRLGFFFTYLLFTGWYMRHYAQHKFWPAIIFLTIFFLIYSIAPVASQILRKTSVRAGSAWIMVMNSLFAFAYSYAMISERFSLAWVSVITVFYSVMFLGMASYLHKQGRHQQDAFVLLLAKAMLFLIITVPIIFSKHWITIFWAAQALTLLWAGLRLDRKSLVGAAQVLFLVAVFKFLLYDYSVIFRFSDYTWAFSDGYTFRIVERLAATIVLLACLASARQLAAKSSTSLIPRDRGDAAALAIALGIVLFIVLNAEASAFFHQYLSAARFAAISVLWTVFSVGLMVLGFRHSSAALRRTAIGLFGATVLKVFLSDMANVSTPYRILSFIILGLVLTGTSYLYYRFRDRIQSVMEVEEKE